MQNKILILLGILVLLGGCFASKSKEQIIVIDKSINLADGKKFVLSKLPKKVAKKVAKLPKKQPAKNWSFPLNSKVIKGFSPEHSGITFATTIGQDVRAVSAGVVIYSGSEIKKYGKMIIIKHPLGFYSAYTQNHTLRAIKGEEVQQADIIALTGKTDFHFKMRKFKTPIDPLKYLKR